MMCFCSIAPKQAFLEPVVSNILIVMTMRCSHPSAHWRCYLSAVAPAPKRVGGAFQHCNLVASLDKVGPSRYSSYTDTLQDSITQSHMHSYCVANRALIWLRIVHSRVA